MTMLTRSQIKTFAFALLLGASACRNDPLIKPANQPPRADARVIINGVSMDETSSDAGAAALTFDFTGTPIPITLDGTNSIDRDGTVKGYRWLSGTVVPDAGAAHRLVPAGAPANWPDDVAQPHVDLGEGIWSFSLWVTDNKGALSDVDVVKITVGKVVDPVVQACADKVVTTEPEACRTCVCNQDDKCRMAVTSDKCDQTCWDLINCVAAKCPDFVAMAAKMPPDYSCLTGNCMAYLAGSTGATPAAPCFRACPDVCAGVPVGGAMGTGGSGAMGTGGSGAMGTGGSASGDDGGM